MKKYALLIKRGLLDENPVFVQLIALCPLLAVTTSAVNAVMMGLSTAAVMLCACVAISLLRRLIPADVRIAAYVIIVSGFVTVLQLLLQAYAPPELFEALGIYIPLIVVNCILFARIESFASKNDAVASFFDALGMGLGFTLGLVVIGVIREFFGSGSVFGVEIIKDTSSHLLIMVMAPGAFFTLGVIIMLRKYFMLRKGVPHR
ncbi:MAG: electron transport complex subunit RsxE [Oscillospiraceae bacterium]|jgi:electron transport complex protein RnfE|nr:electron transport complex subunit RsxE [Oscillospiraceae bacterium]